MHNPRRRTNPFLYASSLRAATRPVPSPAGSAAFFGGALLSAACLAGCSDDAALDLGEETSETGSEALAPELLGEPEITYHPRQPMIVDLRVELDRPGAVELLHDDDPGVKVALLTVEDEGRVHHLRVRGLAPDTVHAMTLSLADLDDPSLAASAPLSFETDYPLPGFRPSFEVELGDAAALDSSYRMFDYAYTPLWEPAGIFVVDPAGVTRWYYGREEPEFPGPTAVWAGVELLEDGSVLAVYDGALILLDELGEERLRYLGLDYGLPVFHHEAHLMANGNFLTLTNSFEDIDYSSVDPELGVLHVAGDLLVELDPAGEIVWTWDAFDHLDPLRIRADPGEGLAYFNPETGEPGYDWTHGNGMVHTGDNDQILLSMRHQDWIIAIDHSSGEILWRLGEEGDFELLEGTWFYHQHSPQWQEDGSLLLYDNAVGNPQLDPLEVESRAVRYALDFDAMTATQVWDSRAGEPYISSVAGDADRTPNGNLLVLDSARQPDEALFDIGKNFAVLRELSYAGVPGAIWTLTTKLGSFVYRATAIDRLPGEAAD